MFGDFLKHNKTYVITYFLIYKLFFRMLEKIKNVINFIFSEYNMIYYEI